jgi:16S rRNA (uracil1498-N3)-methyltransferase
MTAPVFGFPGAELATADRLVLDGPEGRHAARVRRLRVGEPLDLADGAGLVAHCVVEAACADALEVRVASRTASPAPQPRLIVVQALPKGDRGELAVELMTEVGVDAILAWSAERSVARWSGERSARGLERWRSTAREAAKQSRRSWWPQVEGPLSTADVAAQVRTASVALLLHEEAADPLAAVAPPDAGEVLLVVGPEGGIAPGELAELAAAGARAVRMGPTVLRTSTAGAAAAAALLARTPRWA